MNRRVRAAVRTVLQRLAERAIAPESRPFARRVGLSGLPSRMALR